MGQGNFHFPFSAAIISLVLAKLLKIIYAIEHKDELARFLHFREEMILLIVKGPTNDEAICIVQHGLLMETDDYQLYLGRGINSADAVLCRVAKSKGASKLFLAEQEWLEQLTSLSEDLEQERSPEKEGRCLKIHYDWLFPVCEQSFVSKSFGDKQVNVLSIVDSTTDNFRAFSSLRKDIMVDAKSAAWVLGRLLKLQAFLDESKSRYSLDFDPDKVLIDTRERRVVYVGWFDELLRGGDRSTDRVELMSRLNIDRMFDTILGWVKTKDDPGEDDFLYWLKEHIGHFGNGSTAYQAYYAFLDALWGKWYHPFTFYKNEAWHDMRFYV